MNSSSTNKMLLDFGRGLSRIKDAADLLELRSPDFIRLAVSRCIADIPMDLGASVAAARALALFKKKVASVTKRKFESLDFEQNWVQEKLATITLTEEDVSSPPKGNNTIQAGAKNPILPNFGLRFSTSDAFPEKWYDLLGKLNSGDPANRNAETYLLFPRIFLVAMGDFPVRELWSNDATREDAKQLIQQVLRRHTRRVFWALKEQYQAIPSLLETIRGFGPIPPSLNERRKDDPNALQAYIDWRKQPWNAGREFEGWETFLNLPELTRDDLSDQ